jgi:transcriptional regulator GlxA family with amidase domain
VPDRSVLIVLFERLQSLDVTGPLELFAGATRHPAGRSTYRVATASPGGWPVRASSGLALVPDLNLFAVPAPETLGGTWGRRYP